MAHLPAKAYESDRTKEKTAMAMPSSTAMEAEQDKTVDEKIQHVQALYADAPEIARVALAHLLTGLQSEVAARTEAAGTQSAGRIGVREGNVSELTLIAPLAAAGAKRLRGLLEVLEGNFRGADLVGTVHDMRFVFLDNDTKVLFCTAYDGDWDAYIDDFATKIPDYMDLLFSNFDGWPGIHSPSIKDWIVQQQIPAAAWYVATPNLTVADTRRLERVGKALDEFLDKIS
jgi:hypothetical protein